MTGKIYFLMMIVQLAIFLASVGTNAVQAATPSAEQALRLVPMQEGIDFDRPTGAQAAKCKIEARKVDGHVGWIVEDGQGQILRRFVDTNGDNVVDQWSYYKDGVEVYRDIDSDFNGKADQYRWFHTAGSRWGIDENEDGKIDSWKVISAEEVTAEIVAAVATRDADRFNRLILRPEELKSLGLGKARADGVAEKIARLAEQFNDLIARQKPLPADTAWTQFVGNRPGIVPSGTDGSTKDVRVYENVVAIVQAGSKHGEVHIGTLIQIGDAWRVIDLPAVSGEGTTQASATSGFFFQASVRREQAAGSAPSEQLQKLLSDLEKLDQPGGSSGEKTVKFNARRAELIEQIAANARSAEERTMWLRQFADMISAGVQSGTCTDGAERLASLLEKLDKNERDKDLVAYVKFRQLTANYALSLQGPKADFSKVQTQWLKSLEQYVNDYPATPDSAEAMLQLAIAQEFAGQEEEAVKWYGRIVKEFPKAAAAQKAAGAETRLQSVGKSIMLSGTNPIGGTVDLAKYAGRVVLIQYWATWCEPCKADIPVLKELAAKYSGSFAVIGVSLDNTLKDLTDYLAENRLPWAQIYEEGGLDSRPANQLGILTLPTMILVDQQGRVVNRAVQTAELEKQLKKLLK